MIQTARGDFSIILAVFITTFRYTNRFKRQKYGFGIKFSLVNANLGG